MKLLTTFSILFFFYFSTAAQAMEIVCRVVDQSRRKVTIHMAEGREFSVALNRRTEILHSINPTYPALFVSAGRYLAERLETSDDRLILNVALPVSETSHCDSDSLTYVQLETNRSTGSLSVLCRNTPAPVMPYSVDLKSCVTIE